MKSQPMKYSLKCLAVFILLPHKVLGKKKYNGMLLRGLCKVHLGLFRGGTKEKEGRVRVGKTKEKGTKVASGL